MTGRIRRVFVVEFTEPCMHWLNAWNAVTALSEGAPGGKPYGVADVTDMLEPIIPQLIDLARHKTADLDG